jgi:hypothetical protein
VSRFVKTDFDRFDYRCRLTPADWPLDSLSTEHARQHLHAPAPAVPDAATKELIALLRSTNYGSFRKHIKRRAEMVVGRAKSKFTDMEQANRYASLSHEEQTLEQLGALFRIKFNEKDLPSESHLKEQAGFFFSLFLKKHLLASPVEVEVAEMLRAVRVRESRTQLCGLLNGMRCYHRNLAMDLRAVSGMEFKFQLDDELLINSNKQAFENFEKAVKDTQSFFSKDTRESQPLRLTE